MTGSSTSSHRARGAERGSNGARQHRGRFEARRHRRRCRRIQNTDPQGGRRYTARRTAIRHVGYWTAALPTLVKPPHSGRTATDADSNPSPPKSRPTPDWPASDLRAGSRLPRRARTNVRSLLSGNTCWVAVLQNSDYRERLKGAKQILKWQRPISSFYSNCHRFGR
jgi:hypothetical protein